MRKFIKNAVGILSLAVIATGCETESIGPELRAVSADFQRSQVSLSNGTGLQVQLNAIPRIEASWGERVTYKLSVEGLESGAVKVYEGTSDAIDTTWNGVSSNIFFFKRNERATVKLKLTGAGDEFVSEDTISIGIPFTFDGETVDGVKYILIDDFDGEAETPLNVASPSPDRLDENVDFGLSSIAVQGENSLKLKGTDLNGNSWSGDVSHEHLAQLLNKGSVNSLQIDSGIPADELFINAFVYGAGAANTAVQFKISEVDGGDTLSSRADIATWLGAGQAVDQLTAYSTADNDGYVFDVVVDWEGWKLVSIPYSSFRAANDPNNGGGGDRIKESYKISGFTASLLSFPLVGQSTETYVDYIMITQGGRANYNQ